MQDWFTDAKLGIFIHWGSYAVGRRGGESWPIARGKVSYDDYIAEMQQFTARDYDPAAWADLFVRAGAKYAVLTTKHHDGVALWSTKQDGPSLPKDVEGIDDLVGPFVAALRDAGLHTGLYFSHTDWSHLPHLQALSGKSADEIRQLQSQAVEWADIIGEHGAKVHGPERLPDWDKFIDFHRAQLGEILTAYGPLDLIWFDVLWGQDRFDYRCAELRDFIHGICPTTVINSRLGEHGDYECPEQFIPVHPPEGPWELCITTNNTWSFTGNEERYKSAYQIITMFCECLGMGGNMLLNIGPDEHGVIPAKQVELLEALGRWNQKHAEAVYGTTRGLPHGYAYHYSSLNPARDTIYLYVAHIPKEGTNVKGIHNTVKRISVLGDGTECGHHRVGGAPWLNVPGVLAIDIPKQALDPEVTVLKIELEGPLELYGGEGVEIDLN